MYTTINESGILNNYPTEQLYSNSCCDVELFAFESNPDSTSRFLDSVSLLFCPAPTTMPRSGSLTPCIAMEGVHSRIKTKEANRKNNLWAN